MSKRLKTDKDAAPLYIQVKQDIKKKIENGYWKIGDKITSELELCNYYDVSRITIREAINELVWEKYLIRKRAKGTFVLDYKEEISNKEYYTYIKSYTYEMNELGQDVHTYKATVKKIKADEYFAEQLNTSVGAELLELTRVRGIKKKHPVYFKTYFEYSTDFSLDPKDYYGSFYKMLKEKGITLTNIKEYLEAIRPDKTIQKQLNISEDAPVLKRVRNANNEAMDFFEYTECYYAGENYRYYIDLSLNK